jgi:DNA invertase Pin-like site-specific DNA recombinase
MSSCANLPLDRLDVCVGADETARRARGQSIGRPKALSDEKVALARRMHDIGEAATTIAKTLGVSRATVYRVLSSDVES